jgi:hypothetical protein
MNTWWEMCQQQQRNLFKADYETLDKQQKCPNDEFCYRRLLNVCLLPQVNFSKFEHDFQHRAHSCSIRSMNDRVGVRIDTGRY